MAPATKRKTPADAADSTGASYTKPAKKQRTPAPKRCGFCKFTFGPCKGAIIEEDYSSKGGGNWIENSILGNAELLRKHPAVKTALRTLPWEFLQSHYTPTTLRGLPEYEEDTERGTMKIRDNTTWPKFWEATDRTAVLEGHEDAPKVKLSIQSWMS
jgi:hypothetical protein